MLTTVVDGILGSIVNKTRERCPDYGFSIPDLKPQLDAAASARASAAATATAAANAKSKQAISSSVTSEATPQKSKVTIRLSTTPKTETPATPVRKESAPVTPTTNSSSSSKKLNSVNAECLAALESLDRNATLVSF